VLWQMMIVKGHNGTVLFDGLMVTISRRGAIARMSIGKGDKQIALPSITAVQWMPAGLTFGYIQFTIGGGNEVRSRFGHQSADAAHDENTVMFWQRQEPYFEELRDAVEHARQSLVRGQMTPYPPAAVQGPPPGFYPDPGGVPVLRWWNGMQWTEHTQDRP
jgi:hypothetical protein